MHVPTGPEEFLRFGAYDDICGGLAEIFISEAINVNGRTPPGVLRGGKVGRSISFRLYSYRGWSYVFIIYTSAAISEGRSIQCLRLCLATPG